MSNAEFWARKLGAKTTQQQAPQFQQQTPQANEPAWWQAAPPTGYRPTQQIDPGQVLPGGVTIEQLSRMDASTLSAEALEMVAQFKLQDPKYSQNCPHCQSSNVTPPKPAPNGSIAARCFDCGWSGAGIHDETGLQPISKLGAKNSQHISGGGGSGTDGRSFQTLPAEYYQRANPNAHGV